MGNIKNLLGKRIQELRTSKNIKQGKLAEIVGIGKKSLSYIERGLEQKPGEFRQLLYSLAAEYRRVFVPKEPVYSKGIKGWI